MAVNSIKIFDDTVLKLSVNQGLEDQRATETLGSFTMGELAFTRDTGRLFVGDNSDEAHVGLQETVGGILVGNKYLGLIDSKPLANFQDNTSPLKYEVPTVKTGTQEDASFTEQALLLKDSKFRLKSKEGADEEWQRWDRTATYNAKYNAYNGDYMFDIYNNALILFDNRISNDENSSTQPQVVLDEEGTPVTPETFIIDGEEVSSSDLRALDITRRTKLQNYNKENAEYTNIHPVYGDGYVVIRIVEPDNQTIRFRPRAFDANGVPQKGDGNYSHNILEVFNVAAEHMLSAFSDDFVVADVVYLDKDLANIKSITGNLGTIKMPGSFIFSNAGKGGRGAVGYMQWDFAPIPTVTEGSTDDYKIQLVPNGTVQDDSDPSTTYTRFTLNVVKDEPFIPTYRINLEGGLASDQAEPNILTLDVTATGENWFPTLSIDTTAEAGIFAGDVSTPFEVESADGYIYSDNLTITQGGRVVNVDEYSETFYKQAQDKIDRYEEQNTSVNLLKDPVVIVSTSYNKNLLSEIDSQDDLSVNARLDFVLSPYLYCRKKVVSSPNENMLPKVTSTANMPNPGTSYFTSFNDTNVKAWNDLVITMGHNHYNNISNNSSTTPILDDSANSSIKKPVFKTIDGFEVDDNYNLITHTSVDEDSEMRIFAWYKEETEGSPAVYYIDPAFDSRPGSEKGTFGDIITFVRVEGNNTNLINGGTGVVASAPEVSGKVTTTYYAIFAESSLLNRLQSTISYGNADYNTETKYNLVTKQNLAFNYAVKFSNEDLDELTKITFKSGSTTQSYTKAQLLSLINSNNNSITIDTVLPNSSNTPANYAWMIAEYEYVAAEEDNNTDNYEPEDGEDMGDGIYREKVVYQILPNVNYLEGAFEPGNLSGKYYNGTSVASGTINETIQKNNQVYIPAHARNIILEVTHITETNNRIGIFYSNEFENLGVCVSGVETSKEFLPPFTQAAYNSGTLAVPSLNSNFHNKATSIPSVAATPYSPAEKEKALCVTSANEIRVIEVPLQKSKNSGQRHFSLRLANILPTTEDGLNYLAIRVLGYRV